MARKQVRVGTRGSALALEQSRWVVEQLRAANPGVDFRLVKIKTQGDIIQHLSLDKIGGKGLFVKEIEKALLDGGVDLAVHSLKDLPTDIPAGLSLGAISRREDPRDVLVSHKWGSLDELPRGARVGTSSLRRVAQLLHYRPDLEMVPLRGNINTRLRKLEEQQLDGIVIAAAGLIRMNLRHRVRQWLPLEIILPAVGQGALAIEVRGGDRDILALVSPLHDPPTALAVRAERAFLGRLGGGCQVPVGALGEWQDGLLRLQGMVAHPDGSRLFRSEASGSPEDPEGLGRRLAEELLARGASEVLAGP